MRKILPMLALAFLFSGLNLVARAADEKTITGDGLCAKCALKETKDCQNAVQVEEGGKKVTYYVVQNDLAKKFHKNICKSTEKVKVTGTVKEVDGKMEITPTAMDLVKE